MKPLTPCRRMSGGRILACALGSTLAAALFAQTNTHAVEHTNGAPTTVSAPARSGLKHTDSAFIEKAVRAGREEVALARIAVDRSANPDVKRVAQMLIDDHTRANDELSAFASARALKLKERTKVEKKWSRKDAKDFDRDFVKQLAADHKKDIALFTQESTKGGDAELVEFARKTLPKLEHHLEALAELRKTVR